MVKWVINIPHLVTGQPGNKRNKQTHLAVTYLREGGSLGLAIRWNHLSLAITGFPELSVETVKI